MWNYVSLIGLAVLKLWAISLGNLHEEGSTRTIKAGQIPSVLHYMHQWKMKLQVKVVCNQTIAPW